MLAQPLSSLGIGPSVPGVYTKPFHRARRLREPGATYGAASGNQGYEPEGSEHRTLGSISVSLDSRWIGTLIVPIPERQVVFIDVERRGPLPDDYRGSEEAAHLSLPLGEIDTFVALVSGLVAHARHDGVLPPMTIE